MSRLEKVFWAAAAAIVLALIIPIVGMSAVYLWRDFLSVF